MATLKSSSLPEGHITQIEFSDADLRVFGLAATDAEFAHSMARTLHGVGSPVEEALARKAYKRSLDKVIKRLADALNLLREMPPAVRSVLAENMKSIDAARTRLTNYRSSLFPRNNPVDVQTRRILQAVAYQMRKRSVRVTVSAGGDTTVPSLLIRIAQVLLSATGKTIQAETLKQHALNIGLPTAPLVGVPLPSNIGLDGIDWSEGNYGWINADTRQRRMTEYVPKLGWRGFQFHVASSDYRFPMVT